MHARQAANGVAEWLPLIALLTGTGTALVARWITRLLRREPDMHDEPI